ncbi:MAG: winged helix-turn-helix transcriptional regulator [Phycisphaeraceae bacterium]|nr:winged helix-turn-helix transcriptional regulator [Phycisphaeraceae bacterium]
MTTTLSSIGKALSDDTRVRLLVACREGEVCVCQLTALVELAPSTVSKHLQILRDAGLLLSRKDGRWMHYRWPSRAERSDATSDALRLVASAADREGVFRDDSQKLKAICAIDAEDLCRMQREDPGCCFSARATRAAARSPRGSRARSTRA